MTSSTAAPGGDAGILRADTKRNAFGGDGDNIDITRTTDAYLDESTIGDLAGPTPRAPSPGPRLKEPSTESTPTSSVQSSISAMKRRKSSLSLMADAIIPSRRRSSSDALFMKDGFIPPYEVDPAEIEFGVKLGSGAMGDVFQATYKGQTVAAKTLIGVKAKMQRTDKRYKGLMMELEVMNAVGKHPHCVSFVGAVTQSKPIILMELVDGPTLEQYLHPQDRTRRLKRETVAGWSRGLLSGVAHLHSQEPMILHRDLKPDNLILTPDLELLKILDFGVGKKIKKTGSMQRMMTACTGTRRYMAPEVYTSEKGNYNEKADVYSCALIIWEMQTGKKPFEGPEGRFLQQKSMREVMRPSVTVGFGWEALGPVLERAWHLEPAQRPPAAELREMIENLDGAPAKNAPASPLEYEADVKMQFNPDELKLPKCHSGCTVS